MCINNKYVNKIVSIFHMKNRNYLIISKLFFPTI